MKLLLAALFGLMAVATLAAQEAPAKNAPSGDAIHGTGCVRPGVENSCVTLKDSQTGDVFTLFFAEGQTPPPNSGISFEGAAHSGMTTCMQGRAVDVAHWTKVKLRCKSPKLPAPIN